MSAAYDFLLGFFRQGVSRAHRVTLAHATVRLAALAAWSDAQLRESADLLRVEGQQRVRRPDYTAEAVALITESIRRCHGLVAYEVQLLAGLALADGALVEMATGEGKTLVGLLPAFCFALSGRGAHIATVNSYLAERDADFARPVFARLGMSVGLLHERESPALKRAAYACDVTYGVGTEFGFDYLRDQLAIRAAGRVEPRYHEVLLGRVPARPETLQRGHAYAVIDEADSVLIDEARSPLIIAAGAKCESDTPEVYRLANKIAKELEFGVDFARAPHGGSMDLTEVGRQRILNALTEESRRQLRRLWSQYIENALRVRYYFRRDVHYVVVDAQVMIVDEFTGRLCPERTWRDGLHQAVEAAEGVPVTGENFSQATISRPAYFQLYERVCGMTGTAQEAGSELRESYKLRTVLMPPHRPCQRRVLADRVFVSQRTKLVAVVAEIVARHRLGQPVLIGTRTVENSEALAEALRPFELPFRVLNAKQDADESAIIAQAGQPGTITIATNMAGRGAHIPIPEASVRAGGLHVIGLERHESARIDRQLIGRTARQGQPGSAQFFLSLEDDLLQQHAPALALRLAACGTGELPGKFAAYFCQVQRKVESAARDQRRALSVHHQWLNDLKHTL